jgi:hypothetical protein
VGWRARSDSDPGEEEHYANDSDYDGHPSGGNPSPVGSAENDRDSADANDKEAAHA